MNNAMIGRLYKIRYDAEKAMEAMEAAQFRIQYPAGPSTPDHAKALACLKEQAIYLASVIDSLTEAMDDLCQGE